MQRNRPIRLQLAQPRREFCSRELRGTKPVRRQTSLILANFSQLETLSATSQLIFSLYLSLEQDGGLLCLYVFSLASSPQLFTTISLSSLQPVAVWSPRQRTPSPPLSLSDCAEGVFASYQLMLAKESRLKLFSFRRWRRNYVQASLGAPYDDSSLQSLRTFGNAQALV